MLEIHLTNVSKRFIREWIIRDCTYSFQSGKAYALTGPNGSGKSSLAQIISGYSTPTSGDVKFALGSKELPNEEIFELLNYAAPYVELIEEFTLNELLNFHFKLKKPVSGLSKSEILTLYKLENAVDKEIRNFSSGMKQRVKIGLALTTNSELIILDEPTTNLDESGVSWYLDMIEKFAKDKLLIICSNQRREYGFCQENLDMMGWK